jgi:protein gp37
MRLERLDAKRVAPMGEYSKIEWTHHTFNPWWGCQKVSPGCQHCYAEATAKRFGWDTIWGGLQSYRRVTRESNWRKPLKWDERASHNATRERVFCGSMCDVFESRPELHDPRQRLLDLIDDTTSLDWLLLTKRPENIASMIGDGWGRHPENVWLLTTVEDQRRADDRIPHLIRAPARIRGLSVEPMLGPVDLSRGWPGEWIGDIDWVIVGCESGPRRRETKLQWVRDLRDQCVGAGVPFFLKQLDVDGRVVKMPKLDGRIWAEVPHV